MGTSLRELHPNLYPYAQAFVSALQHAGLKVTVNSVRRSTDEQVELYRNYLKCGCSRCPPVPGRCYPASAPGKSPHALGIAFDMSVEPRSMLPAVGAAWEAWGFRWGGRFSQADPIHFDFYPRGYIPT